MSFTEIVTKGIEKIYTEDLDTLQYYLSLFAKKVRGMENADSLFKARAFFVPHEDYMKDMFGEGCTDPFLDMYTYGGECVWQNYIVLPISNVAGSIVGFVGFEPFEKMKSKDPNERSVGHYYRYSRSSVFNRGKYMYFPPKGFEKAVKDGYILLVDGVFDMWSLDSCGFNAGCLLGSSLSEEVCFQLRFIENVFLLQDNDEAGIKVRERLKKIHPGFKLVTQNIKKDVDDILKTDYAEEYQRKLKEAIINKADLVLRFKP
jgi:hypothetical protein